MTNTNAKKRTVVPKLRFPEFREAEAWNQMALGSVCELRAGKFVEASDIAETPGVDLFPCYGGNGLRGYTRTYTHEGQYTLIGRQGALCGNVRQFDGKFHATEHALVVNPIDSIKRDWLFYTLGLLDLNQYAIGQAQPGLSVQVLEKISAFVPPVPEEQQRIADCLTSLDELIAAQGRKVEALKTYKRSLMQQLFPREGETVPRLRFPEFRNAPGWKPKALGAIVEIASGQVDPSASPFRDMLHVGGENIESNLGRIRGARFAKDIQLISGKYVFDETYILYSKIRPALNKVALPDFKGICSADIYPIRPSGSDLLRNFLFYLLLTESFLGFATKHSDRSKIPKINRESLLSYRAPFPIPAEQERISNFLSSFDAQITTEASKFDALKKHKQALMQQLFPTVEES